MKFHRICSLVIIGSGNGLAPYRRQAITWTNDDSLHWRQWVNYRRYTMISHEERYVVDIISSDYE